MIDEIRQTIQEVQAFLAGTQQLEKGRLAELARSYGKACEILNGKSATCRELLQTGKRGDAVRLARSSPDLRESVTVLDMEETQSWLETCDALGFVIPQPLQAEMAKGLVTELYDSSAETGELQRTYRRLSLARAPVADRLRMLRKLYLADPDPGNWAEDVKTFETARIEELAKRAKQADRQGDLKTLEAILAELRSREWVERPKRKLVAAIKALVLPHRRHFAAERYRALLEEIRKAHAAMDEPTCRRLAEKWLAVKDQTGVEPDAALADEFSPVQTWLDELTMERDEQAAFDSACISLEAAVEEEQALHALEKLVAEVLRFERGIPELLAARVNSRLAELRQSSRRRFVVTVVSIALIVSLVGFGVTMAVIWHTKAQEQERWQTRIVAAIDQDDLEAAGRLLDQARTSSPDVFASPEVQELRNRHAQKMAEEAVRKRGFAEAIKAVQEAGMEAPNMAALERADQLAEGFEEKSIVQDWRERIARYADDQRRKREAQIDKVIVELEALHAKLAEARRYDIGDAESLYDSCLRLARQVTAAKGITSLQKAKVAAVEQSAIQLRNEARKNEARRKAIQEALAKVRKACSVPTTLAKELQAFAKKYPEHPLAAEFVQATRMAPAWQPIVSWAKVRAGWKGMRVEDVATAKARLAQVEPYLKDHPAGPQGKAVAAYRDYLNTALRAMPEGRLRNAVALAELLTHPLVADVFLLSTKDGRRFYLLKPTLAESKINGQVISYRFKYVAHDNCTTRSASVKPAELAGEPAPAPQNSFSKEALRAVRGFKGAGWETFYLGLSWQALSSTEIDPVLRAVLVRNLLDYALDIAPVRLPDVERAAGVLQKHYVPVRWMDPNDGEATKTRLQLSRLLEGMSAVKAAPSIVEAALREMEGSLTPYRPVGILLSTSGRIEGSKLPHKGQLYVPVNQPKPNGQPIMQRIGVITGGKVTLDSSAVSGLPRGSLVFVTTD